MSMPFSYFGIFDKEVDYEHLPWRNGKFDPEKLSNKLATKGRAKHVFTEWKSKSQDVSLAFAYRSNTPITADYFNQQGVAAASVH